MRRLRQKLRAAWVAAALGTMLLAAPLALSLATLPAFAQDDRGRALREREALRRAQAALRDSQAQEASLAKEKADLAAQRDQLGETAKRSQSQLATARGEASRLQSSLAKVEAEVAALRVGRDADAQEARARIDGLTRHLADSNRLADERERLIGTLTALLEKSTQALTAAERANSQMHLLGLQMIERIRAGSSGAAVLPDPVLGFGQIRLENVAEALHDQLDATRIKPQAVK